MEITADTNKVATRFAPYVQELHEFFASHGMHFGDLEDLREFSRKLEAPGPFSSELSSMVRSVIFRERGTVPRSELLALVAVSIAGPSVGKVTAEANEPVSQLTDFIAGVVRAPRNEPGPLPVSEFPTEEGTQPPAAPLAAAKRVEERLETGSDRQQVPGIKVLTAPDDAPKTALPILRGEAEAAAEGMDAGESDMREPAIQAGDAYLTSDLQEALKRMETTSLEFRLYLDSIEERVRRIEPRDRPAAELAEPAHGDLGAAKGLGSLEITPPLDEASRPSAKLAASIQKAAAENAVSAQPAAAIAPRAVAVAAIAPAPNPIERIVDGALLHKVSPLTAEAAEPFAAGNEEPALEDRWVRMRSAHAKRIYAGVAGFLVLMIAFLIWQSPDGHQASALPGNVDTGVFTSANRAGSAAKPTPYGQSASGAGQVYGSAVATGRQLASRAQSAVLGGVTGATTTTDASTTTRTEAAAPQTQTATASSNYAAPAPSEAATPEDDVALSDPRETQRSDRRYGSRSYPPGKMVQQRSLAVSSGVMAGNLIFAPPPTYPKLASFTHVQGQVLLQAIVSRSGKVANLKVVRGPRLLRSAAMNAVYKWRYRPYLVSGHAVDVATIVSVDFVLHH